MEELMRKIRDVLGQHFLGAEVDLEPSVPGQKVGGFIIWDGFEGMEQIERQQRVWGVLRRELTREDQLRITAILTLTPLEMAGARAG